jgi:hypothetical protein
MEDLRKDYNVSTPKRKPIWSGISNMGNSAFIKFLLLLIVSAFIIFKPDLIGEYIGKWFNDLTQSFLSNVLLTTDQWYVILVTLFSITVCSVLVKWVNKH